MEQIIKSAVATCARDGYNQVVYMDGDNSHAFSREYPLNNMYKEENVMGRVVGEWKNQIYTVRYIAK